MDKLISTTLGRVGVAMWLHHSPIGRHGTVYSCPPPSSSFAIFSNCFFISSRPTAEPHTMNGDELRRNKRGFNKSFPWNAPVGDASQRLSAHPRNGMRRPNACPFHSSAYQVSHGNCYNKATCHPRKEDFNTFMGATTRRMKI